ncbi:NADP-dependent oxidoreductase [Hymenobacter terricola]|uniref:NADP-dependent oxidoreductase n=1 Tax=Hymenobacter terricola TaxID=2819236 RepID=UPI001B311BC3|nr:NADP-dependent oxidoreductase [Hymenobacter terricola]
MKAVQYKQYGGPEVLTVMDVPEAHAGAGQVRIAARAAGVNPFDWKVRSGMMAAMMPVTFPASVGSDAAGIVDEVGPGVTGVAVGDAVFGLAAGGATQEQVVLASWVRKPGTMSFEEAAGLAVGAVTAYQVLELLGATAGQTILINGAVGGVGLVAVQFAVAKGLTVIGTASEKNHEFLRSLGAIPITYGAGLAARVQQVTTAPIDLGFDVAGHGAVPELIQLTGSPDKVITIADFEATKHGVKFFQTNMAAPQPGWAFATKLFGEGKLRMPIAETFPLAKTGEAQEKSQQGHALGKYVINIG